MKYSTVVVALIIFMNSLFAMATLYIFLKTSSEPTVLIGCWFAFTTGELWLLSGIKKSEIKKGNEYENRLETEIDKP